MKLFQPGRYVPKLRLCQNCGTRMVMVGKRTQTCPCCFGKIWPVEFKRIGV